MQRGAHAREAREPGACRETRGAAVPNSQGRSTACFRDQERTHHTANQTCRALQPRSGIPGTVLQRAARAMTARCHWPQQAGCLVLQPHNSRNTKRTDDPTQQPLVLRLPTSTHLRSFLLFGRQREEIDLSPRMSRTALTGQKAGHRRQPAGTYPHQNGNISASDGLPLSDS